MRREVAVEVDCSSVMAGERTLAGAAHCELIDHVPDDPVASREPDSYAAAISEPQRDDATDWQRVDRALRSLARRRAGLDADEARWLREAEACRLWRHLGMVSAIDYMERILGYGPRTAQDRLRVARALGTLPLLTEALATGELPLTALRELTRVATPVTEAAWRQRARQDRRRDRAPRCGAPTGRSPGRSRRARRPDACGSLRARAGDLRVATPGPPATRRGTWQSSIR